MAEETIYTGNAAAALLNTANTNLDGTGSLGTTITGAVGGTFIKTVRIKATGNTTRGMIRLFITGGGNTRLFKEIDVFPITKSSVNPAFETEVKINFVIAEGYSLKASTQNSENFFVIVEGVDFAYHAGTVREDTTQYTANNGRAKISTANSNLDGTGAIGNVYTAGNVGAVSKGSSVDTITIKGTVTDTPGMVRLYFYNGVTYFIWTEIPIPSVVPDATDQAFEHTIVYEDNLDLPNGIVIAASTENAQNFDIMVQGKDWNYAA